MKLRSFLKPDMRKILILLFLIIIFSPKGCGSSGWGGQSPISCSCYGVLDTFGFGSADSSTYRCYGICDFSCPNQRPEFVFLFMIFYPLQTILMAVILYLITCFVIWTYEKLRK